MIGVAKLQAESAYACATKEWVMKRGPKIMLVTCGLVLFTAYAFLVAPNYYTHATLGFTSGGKLGPYAFVRYGGTNYLWIGLGIGLMIFTVYAMSQKNKKHRKKESPAWTCPNCNEENPGNFHQCWKCQRMRHDE